MSLETNYLGLKLRNPIVASAGPLQQTLDGVKSIADAGVGAIVMFSLMEEQIRAEQAHQIAVEEDHENGFAEALSYFPSVPIRAPGADAASSAYLMLLENAAKAVGAVPVELRGHLAERREVRGQLDRDGARDGILHADQHLEVQVLNLFAGDP